MQSCLLKLQTKEQSKRTKQKTIKIAINCSI
jgi:hypothetical protein